MTFEYNSYNVWWLVVIFFFFANAIIYKILSLVYIVVAVPLVFLTGNDIRKIGIVPKFLWIFIYQ